MRALLIRVGIDMTFGEWNAPVDESGNFVYVPIPEGQDMEMRPGMGRYYEEITPALRQFSERTGAHDTCSMPPELLGRYMHLDPDFEHLTYGDIGDRRGRRLRDLQRGEIIVFYAALRPVYNVPDRLIYALIGLFVVDRIVSASSIGRDLVHVNAHSRRAQIQPSDIVAFGQREKSGRFSKCIPIGEWRNRAYRVREDVLDAWGGLEVKDGYIQRSRVTPFMSDPQRFLTWLSRFDIELRQVNN